jgi:3-oxoacyl-[acyl-carrier-protein] synthase-3
MTFAALTASGSYLPDNVVNNEDLHQFASKFLPLIEQKTGVKSRRLAHDDQCTSDLAILAAQDCLSKSDRTAADLDAIIVSTSSPDRIQPATATRVQHKIGACNAFAFDINSVCSGTVFGIALIDSLIKTHQCQRILLVASELYSKILDTHDFSTFPFFGDGAGALLFSSSPTETGILHSCMRTDGSGSEIIRVPGGGTMLPFDKISKPEEAFFRMNGRAVYEFAVSKGIEIIRQLISEVGISLQSIKYFVCHQANIHILRAIADGLQIPADRFFTNVQRYGNTASASVIIALDEIISKELVQKDDLIVTVAFGGGLSWGANLLRI